MRPSVYNKKKRQSMSEKKEKEDIKKTQKYLVKGTSGGMFGGSYPEYFEDYAPALAFAEKQSFISGEETLVYLATDVAVPEIHKCCKVEKVK